MPRYDSVTKSQRNHEVLAFTQAHSNYSLKEIGRQFNLSGERVRQILKREKGASDAK